jgi:hypothetical protein
MHSRRGNRRSKSEARVIPRFSIYLGPVLVTNAFNNEWPLSNVFRGARAKVRFAVAFVESRVELRTACFCLHRSTYSCPSGTL